MASFDVPQQIHGSGAWQTPCTINSVTVKTGMEAMRLLLSLVRQGRDSKASCTKGERPGHSWNSPEMRAVLLISLTTVSLTLGQTIHPFCRGEEVTGRLVSHSTGIMVVWGY